MQQTTIPFIVFLPAVTRHDELGNVVEVIPPQPCPELLTSAEAARYLRLDETSVVDPENALRYYRREWGLKATQVGRNLRYRRIELDRLIAKLTDENPH